MGRPSKLTEREWAELGRRLAAGESYSQVAKSCKVSKASLVARFSDRLPKLKEVATMMVNAEGEFEKLTVSDQVAVRSLTDHLKGLTQNAAKAAATGMQTATILHDKALKAAQNLGKNATAEDLRFSDALLTVAGKASALGTQLMAANKGAVPEENGNVTVVTGVPRG